MTDLTVPAYSDGDIDTNQSEAPSLDDLVAQRYSRRAALAGGLKAAGVTIFAGSLLAACGTDGAATAGNLVVEAGESKVAAAGSTVTLSGSATGDGAVTQVAWTQESGLAVELEEADSMVASFVAPAVTTDTELEFRFTATDGGQVTKTDRVKVIVTPSTIEFAPVPKSLQDIVSVPEGYSVSVIYALGDPIDRSTPTYRNDGTDDDFDHRAGDHHDALYYFGLDPAGTGRDDSYSGRGLLVMNHENISQDYLHPNGPTVDPSGNRPEAEARKEMLAHGLSIVEVRKRDAGYRVERNSRYNRRITPLTPMQFNGPVAGDDLLKTQYSPDGTEGRGTINNCANGYTAWGTDITCEENWAFYFKRDPATDNPARAPKEVTALSRYGVTSSTGNYGWTTVQPADPLDTSWARWNAAVLGADATADFRNEPNQFGWVVEIDPYDPASTPRKRTALGRMGHEGCWPSRFMENVRPAFYMGDDARNDYLYKFVSATPWNPADANAADRLAIGDKYLDNGTLYVAKFNADGTGEWLPLVFGQGGIGPGSAVYPFANQADVLAHARLAADTVGATKMDRPEWTAVNPLNGEVYLTLTNNNASNRPLSGTDAANPRHYNDPRNGSPQFGNPNGHIVRLAETSGSSEAVTFEWDIYVFGAGSDLDPDNINISELDDSNDFSSPDGIWFSRPQNLGGQGMPLLWIQTDDGAYADVTNCMMLVGQPGEVGDGEQVTITNRDSTGATAQQATRIGAKPGDGLRRFLVGPKECEITGVDSTPNGRALFVNIQHPGEDGDPSNPTSNWPASQNGGGGGSRPRSATIVITKNDQGIVGF